MSSNLSPTKKKKEKKRRKKVQGQPGLQRKTLSPKWGWGEDSEFYGNSGEKLKGDMIIL
jgi:hypothetical protein